MQEREEQDSAKRTDGNAGTAGYEKAPVETASGGTAYIEVKTCRNGEVVFYEGTDSDCMYEVRAGRVGIYKEYGTEEEELITELGSEDVFGEMGMVEGAPRSATAVAMEDGTEVVRITWPILGEYFKSRPSRIVLIMQQISDRLRRTTQMQTDAVQTIRQALEVANTTEDLGEIRRILQDHLKENG